MPLSPEVAPCNLCIDEEMLRIAEETGEDLNVSSINLHEITKTSRYCVKCGNPFCADHASPIDQSDCCNSCLPIEDLSEMKTPLLSQDDAGNTHIHKGYRIVPTGLGYKTLPKAIASMTDLELTEFITEKKRQLDVVEKQRDYLRVAQSTAKLEKGDRENAAARALRGMKVKMPSQTGVKITGKANGSAGVKGVTLPGNFDVGAFLKFVASQKTNSSVVGTAPTEKQAPLAAESVPKKEGGDEPDASPPSLLQGKGEIISPAEAKREEEIEKILNESEEEKHGQ